MASAPFEVYKMPKTAGPLEGIKVVETTEGAQGPWAACMLSDLGAEVIKIEKPTGEMSRVGGGPKKHGIPLANTNRNHGKRNLCIDLKTPESKTIVEALIKWADVFMENWRPGVSKRLGCDYETASKINPRIIYGSASGYGQTGKYAHKGSTDTYSQAMGGQASLTGPKGGPGEFPRFIVIDFTSPLTFAQGIIMALISREKTGRGQWVQCSQLETQISVETVRAAEYFITGKKPVPLGSESVYCVPSQAFKTADTYIMVDCPTEATWVALCKTMERPDLAKDQRFVTNADRVNNRDALQTILNVEFREYSSEIWLKKLEQNGVPCGRVVLDLEQLYDDPQVKTDGLVVRRPHPVMEFVYTPELAWTLSRTPAFYKGLAAELGEHNEEIMRELGLPIELTKVRNTQQGFVRRPR